MALTIGGITYPLTAQATGATLLPVADPFLAVALPFWQQCIETYMSSAYVAVMANQVTAAANAACVTTFPIDPVAWIDIVTFRPPLLACYPVSGNWNRLTSEHDRNAMLYRLAYILPGVSFDQMTRVAPMLQAVINLIMLVTEQQSDPSYNSNQKVWTAAGCTSVAIGSWEIGFMAPKDEVGHQLPTLLSDVHVVLRNEWNYTGAVALTYGLIQTGVGDGGTGVIDDLIEGRTDIPVTPG